MDDGVKRLVLSTSGLLVLLNAGIGILALWGYRSGLRATERLIASGELDVDGRLDTLPRVLDATLLLVQETEGAP